MAKRQRPEAAAVTCGAFRCSLWLDVLFIVNNGISFELDQPIGIDKP